MIQYYKDLEIQVANIKAKEVDFGQIQKIYSTAYFISFSIRTPGKTWHLYLGRGSGIEGVWLHSSPPPSELRRKDNFLEYLRRYLSSCTFLSAEIDEADRIFQINYQKYGSKQSILFFWKARKLYFLHYFQDGPETPFKLLLSWHGKAFLPDSDLLPLAEYFDEVGRKTDMKQEISAREFQNIPELLDSELKAASLNGMTSSPTFLQRKKDNIEDDLRKARQWEKLQLLLDKNHVLDEMYELKVGDHKIKFEGDLNPYERRNLVFQKIKKLKRGESILTGRLSNVQEQLSGKLTEVKKTSALPIHKPVWGKEATASETKKVAASESNSFDFKVFKFESFQIGVGLSSRGNDQLRNKWASKEDTWIHLDGDKSAHAIIKSIDGQAIGPDALNTAATIVAHFSHFMGDWISIIHTPVKNLKGVTGAPGMVIYKKEKHLKCPKITVPNIED